MDRKFLLAKVNINGNIFNDDYHELIKLIPETFTSGYSYKGKRSSIWTWEFGEIETFMLNNVSFYRGFFTRSRELEIISNQEGKLLKDTIPKVSHPSFFLYEPISELLLFEETGDIPRKDFINAFESFVYSANFKIGKIEIKLIANKDEVFAKVFGMDNITKVEFDLVYPNGLIDNKAFKDLENFIKEQNSTRVKVTLENGKGLDKNGMIIQGGTEMVSQGYGDVKAYGYDEITEELPPRSKRKKKKRKKQKKYNSKDSIFLTKINKVFNKKESSDYLAKFIMKAKSIITSEKSDTNEPKSQGNKGI